MEENKSLIKKPQFWLAVVTLLYMGLALFIPPDFSYAGGNFELNKSYSEFLIRNFSFGIQSHIAPGQPVILALLSTLAPLTIVTVRILQVVLLVILILETYLVAKLLFTRQTALIASGVLALWPPLVLQIFSQSVDLLFSVLFLCAFYFFMKAEKLHRWDYAAAAGVAAAAAALTDPVGLYFPLFFVAPFAVSLIYTWFRSRSVEAQKHFFLIIIFVLVFFASLIPWYYRNITVFGGMSTAPLIQKGWETEFLKSKEVRGYVLDAFKPHDFGVVGYGLRQFFLIPFSIDALDQNTEVSYKRVFLESLSRGEGGLSSLSSGEKAVFFIKVLVTALHLSLLLLALVGMWSQRKSHLAYIYVGLVVYLIIATFSYGVPERFGNISPLNGFFFLILPLTVILGTQGILFLKKKTEIKNSKLKILRS